MFLRIRAELGPKPAAARRIAFAAAVAALALTACSTDNPLSLRPDVDVHQTSSLSASADSSDVADTFESQSNSGYVAQDPAASDYPDSMEPDPSAGGGDPNMVWQAGPQPVGGEETLTDEASLADPTLVAAAGDEATASDGIDPYAVNPGLGGSSEQSMSGAIDPYAVNPALGSNEQGVQTAALMRPVDPAEEPYIEPQDVTPEDVMPASEVTCRVELKKLGVVYEDIDRISGGGSCGIEYPVKVRSIGSVKMQPAATLRCEMAATFAAWTRNELVPAARRRYLSGVKTIHQASSYSCRNIRRSGGVMSEHGKGNALDVARIELNSGRDIDVEKPGWFAFRTKGFLNSVRTDGCDYFTTVLGPGYDRDHKDHFHFDLKQRRSGHRACK